MAAPSRRRVRVRAGATLPFSTRPLLLTADACVVGLVVFGLPRSFSLSAVLVFVMILGYLYGAGLFRSRLTLSVLDDLPSLALAVALGTCVAVLLPLPHTPVAGSYQWQATFVMVGLIGTRFLAYTLIKAVRRSGLVRHPAVVIGSGQVAQDVVRVLASHREFGLNVLGHLDAEPHTSGMPVPWLGVPADLAAVVKERGVREVLIALDGTEPIALLTTVARCQQMGCHVFVVPRTLDVVGLNGRRFDEVWGIPLIRQSDGTSLQLARSAKRGFDIILSGIALVALSPLLACVALAVRLENGAGVLYRQERVGLDGRTFEVLKFRSFRPAISTEADTVWSIDADPGLGPVGRVIRKTSLDELPQLWNVLRGHMSLVGPRPERPYFVALFSDDLPHYQARHRVPVGLTGWAQVHGLRGNTSIPDRVIFDNNYIQSWSMWLDIKILLRTVGHLLTESTRPGLAAERAVTATPSASPVLTPDAAHQR